MRLSRRWGRVSGSLLRRDLGMIPPVDAGAFRFLLPGALQWGREKCLQCPSFHVEAMALFRSAATPSQRALRVYAFDPSRGARLDNVLTIRVPYEPLKRGPVGAKIAVIDYDASNERYYEGINLDDTNI